MRLIYVLLSPTFGMHQYAADLANRMAGAGHDVHLVTTQGFPRDRYTPAVTIHTPVQTAGAGFGMDGLRPGQVSRALQAICALQPDAVHFAGPHLWNVPLVMALRRRGLPVAHTLHDLNPHRGMAYGSLLHVWNGMIWRTADHILVHGGAYRDRLVRAGLSSQRITQTPLLHLFLGHTRLEPDCDPGSVTYGPWALFFGRLERYKGVDFLLTAAAMLNGATRDAPRLVVAGPGRLDRLWAGPAPATVELRNRLIGDEEALDLFRTCGLLVLPYVDATQSALVAAAYFFRKPVLVTRTGALPEYVHDGVTGMVVEPEHAAGLARALACMLEDTGRLAGMGTAGREWYDRAREAETLALFRMYDRLVDGRKRERTVG